MLLDKYFTDINIKIQEETDDFMKMVAEPFERGYGVTVGNSLRRILLTCIPGAAVTSLKIDGVPHEFSSIDGVMEDVTEIVLNLKEVRFSVNDEEPELISIKLNGPCKFTAKDIQDQLTNFKVLNPNHHIMTLNTKKEIDLELRVSRGKGYSIAENNKRKDDTLGTIPIDAIYNPILNVAWTTQPIATSSEGHERLIMEISSDGSTTPKDAINHAAFLAQQHFSFFRFDDSNVIKAVNDKEISEAIELKTILLRSIDEMELSVRSHNCLQAAGIKYIWQLVSKDESEMLKFKNFGRKSLTELVAKLGDLDLGFGMDISNYIDNMEE